MMNISAKITIYCAAFCLVQTSVLAGKKFKSINDLKKINFGLSVPSHSLLLLHWFANTVHIDNNDVTRLPFDPNDGDYGTHHYGNFERMLDPVPQGYRYYTVGNLNEERANELPGYVTNPRREYVGGNRDRIIFRVSDQNRGWQRIDRVYVTQHYEPSEHQGTRYDPEHTYQVSARLLREIQEFTVDDSQRNSLSELRDAFGSHAEDSKLKDIRNQWGHLACLGLLLYIVIKEKHSPKQQNRPRHEARRPDPNEQSEFVVDIPETETLVCDHNDGIGLEVVSGTNGKARIRWSRIPRQRLKDGVMVVLFDNNEDQKAKIYKCVGHHESGTFDSSVPLNDGLQARLHKVRTLWCFFTSFGEEICRGPEFKNPEAVNINGYNAGLQLFAKDGKACARLYVKKTFREWRSDFHQSWVGFYTSANKATNDYEWLQWQWATKFKPNNNWNDSVYDVYEYHSGLLTAPGVQARFILRDQLVGASTPSFK